MSDVIRIFNADGLHPVCAHEGCKMLALAGYCEASCCVGYNPRRAYCSEHSHAPQRVLEILGHGPSKPSYSRDEVLQVVRSMWAGAGLVMENAGKFEMEQDLAEARRRLALTQANAAETTIVADGSVGEVSS